MKCTKCKGKYIRETVSKVFLNKYIKDDVEILRCENCGHELMPFEEVEKAYQEIKDREKANLAVKTLRVVPQKVKMFASRYTLL